MLHTYSLADFQLTIGLTSDLSERLGLRDANGNPLTSFVIGGPGEDNQGSFVGQIIINRSENLFTTEGDATGSWVHNKNLNRTGSITLELTQISDQVVTLIQLCQILESVQSSMPGLELTVSSASSAVATTMITGKDAYIQKLPDITLADVAGRLSWVFTCGQVIYEYSK